MTGGRLVPGMPVLTLWQPWASLIAVGVKTIETRSWKAPDGLIGERIAIHAAARVPTPTRGPMFVGDFHVAQGGTWLHGSGVDVPMPFGAVVATARLAACVPMLGADDTLPEPWMPHLAPNRAKPGWSHWKGPNVHVVVESTGRHPWIISDVSDELPFGDFAPGRWAWLLDDVERLAEPVPARGRQRIWRWQP